jgi:ligand-binding sensor domain-containing protein
MRRFLSSVVFIILFLEAFSQDYTSLEFSAITSNDGLPSIECNFVYQDVDDFLWIGTNEGLYRYDGYSLKGFDLLVNYPSKNLKFLNCAEDKNGNMSFGTSNGIIIYSRSTNEIIKIKPSERLQSTLINNKFPSLTYDNKGRIWFGNSEGLFLFDTVADTLICFTQEASVKDIVFTESGDIWIASGLAGLAKVNEEDSTLSQFQQFNDNFKKGIYSLSEGSENVLWVGTWDNGLYAFDISKPDQLVVKKSFRHSPDDTNTISGDIIFDMATDNYGNLWVGSPYGLNILQDPLSEDVSIFNYKYSKGHNSLTNNEIRSIIKDRTGVMWMATEGGGVNKVDIHKNKFKPYAITEIDPQKKSQTVQSFTFDPDNKLLIGVKSLAFGSYDIEKELFVHFEDIPRYAPLKEIKINTVKNFTWDSDSGLWLGTRYKGLIKYDIKTGEYRKLKILKGDRQLRAKEIFSVKKDLNKDLWVVANSGLFRVFPGKTKAFDDFYVQKVPVSEGKDISDIAFDKSGRIWIATFKGNLIKSEEPVNNHEEDISFVYVNKGSTSYRYFHQCSFL